MLSVHKISQAGEHLMEGLRQREQLLLKWRAALLLMMFSPWFYCLYLHVKSVDSQICGSCFNLWKKSFSDHFQCTQRSEFSLCRQAACHRFIGYLMPFYTTSVELDPCKRISLFFFFFLNSLQISTHNHAKLPFQNPTFIPYLLKHL